MLPDEFPQPNNDEEPFVAERARFALADDGLGGDERIETDERIGTVAAIRETTDEIVAEITTPDGECPHCGLALSEDGPPMCPRCGAPY